MVITKNRVQICTGKKKKKNSSNPKPNTTIRNFFSKKKLFKTVIHKTN